MREIAVNSHTERHLRDRIEELEEEVRQLKADAKAISFPYEWRLTAAQARLLRRMYELPGAFITLPQAYDALRLWADGDSERNLVRSQICKMRPKLAPFGIEIRKRWGEGYDLPESTVANIKAVLSQRQRGAA